MLVGGLALNPINLCPRDVGGVGGVHAKPYTSRNPTEPQGTRDNSPSCPAATKTVQCINDVWLMKVQHTQAHDVCKIVLTAAISASARVAWEAMGGGRYRGQATLNGNLSAFSCTTYI